MNESSLHPATWLLIWFFSALVLQLLDSWMLFCVVLLLLLTAMSLHVRQLFSLFRRTRWIFLSLFVLYAFLTPGIEVWSLHYLPTITYEGLQEGAIQVSRLAGTLSALAILLALLARESMLLGIFVLLFPIRWLGGSRELVAVRLMLTLQYAEEAMAKVTADWRSTLTEATALPAQMAEEITLKSQPYSYRDFALWILGLIFVGMLV